MAKPAPDLHIAPSSATVDVRIIDTKGWIYGLPSPFFFTHSIKGHDHVTAPIYVHLIEHPSGRRILFDLGMRKDWENLAPRSTAGITEVPSVKIVVEKGVREQLEEHGVPGSSIEAIIWSHWHLDHTGDPSTFDTSTALVVGPGFREAFIPGYPANENSPILETDYKGRELREIQFDQGKKIGRFNAFDYFGDGSFYLLDAPGHAIGHLCGLARVTSDPDSYIFMGGDAAHHAGEFRPSEYLPLPDSITPNPLEPHSTTPCPGAVFEQILRDGDKTKRFYEIASKGLHADPAEATRTVDKLQDADGHSNILVVIAHDESLFPILDFFPKSANDFLSKDWVSKGKWAFLKDFKGALA